MNTKSEAQDEQDIRTYLCVVCGFVYDAAEGLPEEGVAPGTDWQMLPESWVCPDCGVDKSAFQRVAV